MCDKDIDDIRGVFKADYKQFNWNGGNIRNIFQRDRDRILYSKEFRRLSGKTQVFVSGFDDNMRTRLTHTLEVAQIAKTISSYLGLDLDLIEAISYGHDVGHTPFGHIGERTLNHFMNGCYDVYDYKEVFDKNCNKGFKHNLQGYYVCTELERSYNNQKGLDLTNYTLWGILHHTSVDYKAIGINKSIQCELCNGDNGVAMCLYKGKNILCNNDGHLHLGFYKEKIKNINESLDWTVEGIIVNIADEIAQRHHDLEDGIFANLIDYNLLVKKIEEIFGKDVMVGNNICQTKDDKISFLSHIIINLYVEKCCISLTNKLKEIMNRLSIKTNEDFNNNKKNIYDIYLFEKNIIDFGLTKDFVIKDNEFQKYLRNIIINSELTQTMNGKAQYIIGRLFKAYLNNPQQLPNKTIISICEQCGLDLGDGSIIEKNGIARNKLSDLLRENNIKYKTIIIRTICNYIAGMTDAFAIKQYGILYGDKEIKNLF